MGQRTTLSLGKLWHTWVWTAFSKTVFYVPRNIDKIKKKCSKKNYHCALKAAILKRK